MRKNFSLGLVIGIAAFLCLGAATMLIHDYPSRTTIAKTDMFLIDTGTNYQNITWANLGITVTNAAAYQAYLATNGIFNAPTITGPLTIVGGTGTNVLEGVNELTNVFGVTLAWKTNAVIFGDMTTNNIIYLGFQ